MTRATARGPSQRSMLGRVRPRVGGEAEPHVGGRSESHAGGRAVPEVGGRSESHAGGRAVPEVGGRSVPDVGGRSVPDVGGRSVPDVGGRSVPHVDGRSVPRGVFVCRVAPWVATLLLAAVGGCSGHSDPVPTARSGTAPAAGGDATTTTTGGGTGAGGTGGASMHPFGASLQVSQGGLAHDPSLALDSTGSPAVAWTDAASGTSQIYVARFASATWAGIDGSAAGGGISLATGAGVGTAALALDVDDTPAVAWTQSAALAAGGGGGSTGSGSSDESPVPPSGGGGGLAVRDALMLKRDRGAGWQGLANTSTSYPANSGVVPGIFAVGNITWSPTSKITNAIVGPPSAPGSAALAIVGPQGYRVALAGTDARLHVPMVYQVGFNVLADTGHDNSPGTWGFMPPYSASFARPDDTAQVRYAAPQVVARTLAGAEVTYMGFLRNGQAYIYLETEDPNTHQSTWRMAATPIGQNATELALDVDASLQAFVAYTVPSGARSDVFVAMLDANAMVWTPLGGGATPGNATQSAAAARHPSIAAGSGGRPVLAWEDTASGHAAIYVRGFDGAAWAPIGASDSGAGVSGAAAADATQPRLCLDASGRAVLAWQSGGIISVGAWY